MQSWAKKKNSPNSKPKKNPNSGIFFSGNSSGIPEFFFPVLGVGSGIFFSGMGSFENSVLSWVFFWNLLLILDIYKKFGRKSLDLIILDHSENQK